MFFDIVYLLLLLSGIVILIENRVIRTLRFLSIQGFLLTIPVFQVHHWNEGFHFWVLIVLVLVFKAVMSPMILYWTVNKMNIKEGTNPRFGSIATLFFLVFGLVGAVFFIHNVEGLPEGLHKLGLIYVLLMIYVGILTFIIRRHWIVLIAGFIMFENGIFILTLLLHNGLPLGIELGSFVDAVLIIVSAVVLKLKSESLEGNHES
jgi:hydrogenase-4 component E